MPREVPKALYDRLPDVFENVEGKDADEVIDTIHERIRARKYKQNYTSYWRIKEEQDKLETELTGIDIADPIEQLRLLDQIFKQMFADAKPTRILIGSGANSKSV